MLRVFQGGVGFWFGFGFCFFFPFPLTILSNPSFSSSLSVCLGDPLQSGPHPPRQQQGTRAGPHRCCWDVPGVSEIPGEGVTSAGTDFFPTPDTKQTLSEN